MNAIQILISSQDRKEKGLWLEVLGEGEMKSWWPSKVLREHFYMKGSKKDGLCKWWYFDGTLSEESYWKQNQRHGETKVYSIYGQLIEHKVYRNGKEIKDYLEEKI